MRCIRCKTGKTKPGTSSLTLERDDAVVVIRSIPGEVCQTCGEAYYQGDVTDRVMAQAEVAFATGAKVHVAQFLDLSDKVAAPGR